MTGMRQRSASRSPQFIPLTLAIFGLVFTLGMLGPSRSFGVQGGPHGFCSPATITDFDAPLDSLPDLDGVPDGALGPFSPASVRLRMSRPAVYPVGFVGDAIPYVLENKDSTESVTLNWSGRTQVERVGVHHQESTGSGYRTESTWQVGTVAPGAGFDIGTNPISAPGIYAVTVDVEKDGILLGAYQEYTRVMDRRWAVRLASSSSEVPAGGVLHVRLENRGNQPVAFGEGYALERLHRGRWLGAGGSGPTFASSSTLPAGTTSRCTRVAIPAGAAPGRYRVRKTVGSLLGREKKTVWSAFRVVGVSQPSEP